MKWSGIKNWRRLIPFFLALWVLAACATDDKPFSLVGDSNEPPPLAPDGSVPPPGGTIEGCFINFVEVDFSLSVSAAGLANDITGTRPLRIDPIPIKVDGGTLTIIGDIFPKIYFDIPADKNGDEKPVDLLFGVAPGTEGSGSYDASTGAIIISGVKFTLDLLKNGKRDLYDPDHAPFTLDPTDLTTGLADPTDGNATHLQAQGVAFNPADKSLVLALGLKLPDNFGDQDLIDSYVGGGELTATFTGKLEDLPENCKTTSGGGGEPTPPTGPSGPEDFSILVDDSSVSEIDFGTALVLTKKNRDKTILDCAEAVNRSPKSQLITLKNTSAAELKIKVMAPADTDGDGNDPLCSGSSEFVRGTIKAHGAASCDTVSVGGKLFTTTECSIPSGDDKSYLTFPLLYVPFNFVEPPEAPPAPPADPAAESTPPAAAPQAPQDEGALLIEYNDSKSYSLRLVGRTEADSSDSFSISKVSGGVVGTKEFHSNDVVKISLASGDPKPFTQTLELKNSGGDTWEEVTVTFPTENSAYSVGNLAAATLPAVNGSVPGTIRFDVIFNPPAGQAFTEPMKITMVRAGSKTSDNPQGTVAEINLTLEGTVGIPALSGTVKFQIDFLTGKIDHDITVEPVESLDFRAFPTQAPPPLDLVFTDTSEEGIKAVALQVTNKSPLEMSRGDRETALRILNAQGSVGLDGIHLNPGDSADLCNEPENIDIPYDSSRHECSYFYFQISGDQSGVYDNDTGELTLPEISLRIENPYHNNIGGSNWPASSPPNYVLDTSMVISLTTLLMNEKTVGEGEDLLNLVPDSRIQQSDLVVKGKPIGKECPGDFGFILNHDPSTGTLEEKHPHLRCYLSSDERYLKGRSISIRPDDIKQRDVVLVGVGRFRDGNEDPNMPWFMGDFGGSRMYIGIQGRLIVE